MEWFLEFTVSTNISLNQTKRKQKEYERKFETAKKLIKHKKEAFQWKNAHYTFQRINRKKSNSTIKNVILTLVCVCIW